MYAGVVAGMPPIDNNLALVEVGQVDEVIMVYRNHVPINNYSFLSIALFLQAKFKWGVKKCVKLL